MESEVTNTIIVLSMIGFTGLSHPGASAVMHVNHLSLSSPCLPLYPIPSFSCPPDPLHAYLGLCGLSLIGEPSLRKVHPALNITQRAFQHLQQLQQTWRVNTGSCSRQHWQHDDPQLWLWTGSVTVVSQRQLDFCCVSWRRLAPHLRGLIISGIRKVFFGLQLHTSNLAELILSPFKVTFLLSNICHTSFLLPFYS